MLALAGKTGDCHMQALKQVGSSIMEDIITGSRNATFVFVTDWAKANRRLYRMIVRSIGFKLALHSRCFPPSLIHQGWRAHDGGMRDEGRRGRKKEEGDGGERRRARRRTRIGDT
eukprot:5436392-Pyramimonas_sp.AAC.1